MEDGLHVGAVGRRGGAQLQRTRHRVRRGLVGVDPHRRGDRIGAGGLGDDVEVLPAEHLGADIGPHPAHPGVARPAATRRRPRCRRPRPGPDPRAGSPPTARTGRAPRASSGRGAGQRISRASWVCRGGSPRRRSRRRAPARRRAATPVRRTAAASRGRVRRRPPRATPSRRTPGAAACRRTARTLPARPPGPRSPARCRRCPGGGPADTRATGR
ncbi:hypothetical protein C1Y40_01655 [Mycobacterium talmoniae]|uniref:Uncharacterized protein n=1 Tax=Mycobacterium talmoniae TaxID=1858794 RepID=A0A2S8BN67_9MYCO|nr:hypothetical protein C1Y40_01655 [Mycobacterium talmoniae]